LDDKDPEQLKEWTLWLNKALETRRALREMGIEPEYNFMFGNILRRAKLGLQPILADKGIQASTPRAAQRAFAEAYTKVLADYNAAVLKMHIPLEPVNSYD